MRRLQAHFGHRRHRLGPAADRRDVGQRVEIPLPLDVLLDRRQQVPKADAGQEDHHVDLARDQPMGKIDRLAVLLDRHLAHARADERPPAEFLDQPGHLGRVAAFERGDAEVGEDGLSVVMRPCYLPGRKGRGRFDP